MVKGIGIDTVCISETERLIKELGATYTQSIFTSAELRASENYAAPAEFLAGRFAVKEAVFKAVAHLTQEKGFDMRIIETLNEPDGHPVVIITDRFKPVIDEAGIGDILISITNEGDYATAIAVANAVL